MAQINANLEGVTPQEGKGFEVRSPGWYPLRINDSDIKTKEGSEPCIHLEIVIEDGRPGKVWDYLSLGQKLTKSGKTAQEISFERLKAIAIAVGHPNPNYIADTGELHGLRCLGKLKIKKDPKGVYDDKNEITAYKPITGNAVPAPPQATETTQAPPYQQQAPPYAQANTTTPPPNNTQAVPVAAQTQQVVETNTQMPPQTPPPDQAPQQNKTPMPWEK